ncbi:MAG TPA: DUF305 domain-containing protein [Streptomyces sp.]|uniref:DUF305 domain-containing protein n=1 Tax=Streptomyces sp. TaxID=1931 RepID=UPI002D342FBD|nr:DUF305 domain-containing protein [Streptomyces sp.]HZG04868.1 DUF305 domain-containing protein [Streptomyces sp.]
MTAHRSAPRRLAAVAVTVTTAVVLTACGGNNASTGHAGHGNQSSPRASASPSTGEHNAADVSFAQGMIPHHRQAVEMADLAADRAASQEVKDLAADIEKAQQPEIDTLTGWLTSWGEDVPAEGSADHSGHGVHGGHGRAGMMTPEQMDELEKSSGKAFDTAFLEMMIEHHKGAVAMARTEKENGAYGPAKSMADDIIATQNAEIDTMNKLLGKE